MTRRRSTLGRAYNSRHGPTRGENPRSERKLPPSRSYMQQTSGFCVAETECLQARAKGRAYGITGVPVMIVNGKYRVGGRMAGSNEAMLDVVHFLVRRELAGD